MGCATRLHQAVRRQHAARARAVDAANPRPAATDARSPLIPLQRSIGNRAVGRLVQAKLRVGRPDDRFEQEADRVAAQVMRAPPAGDAVSPARPPRLQRLCAGCDDELRRQPEEIVAAKARPGEVPDLTPDLDGRIRSLGGGRPLPEPTRALFEDRLGRDLGGVRLHTDAGAAATARGLRARAFTAGRDIVFGAGEYAPGTTAGRSLLAHELVHAIQQGAAGLRGARASPAAAAGAPRAHVPPASARPVAVQRQPAPAGTGMTRDDFAKRLKVIFGHDVTVEVGDRARQTRELGGPRDRRRLPDDWTAWDPDASTPLYDEILGAIEDFAREVGGVPDISQLVFFNVHYGYDAQDNVVANPDAAASIRGRVMYVYRAALFPTNVVAGGSGFTTSGVLLASKRSTAGSRGASAPMAAATRAESQRRTVAHELGHGVERATGSLREFEEAVGWVRVGRELRLYDIQARGVKAAIARGTEPPAAARITKRDWNSGAHLEQPMREYAVTDSTEDFADSLMAWLYARDTLKARSPARFKFFDDHARRSGWLPKLVTPGAAAAPTRGTP